MERVINLSKQVLISIYPVQLWRSWFSEIQPNRTFSPDFGVRGDHLFLAKIDSVKDIFPPRTVVGIYILGFTITFVITILSVTLSVSPFLLISGAITLFYFIFMGFKIIIIATSVQTPLPGASDEQLAALSDEALPIYTVLLPLRDESEVADQIIKAMRGIDYPTHKLDFIVTVEKFDHATKEALIKAGMPEHWRIIELPDTNPKTKPKALNCAFLEAKGEYLVIYDAEIIPDKDQLKKALCVFAANPSMAVLQPHLDHYNTNQNMLTRLFTIEFTFHYDMFLPGLARFSLPVPLSGHSAHFKMTALKECGAWDPYNVAEDCEIGMRLYRRGYRSSVFDSVSYEEAASSIDSWIKQRTRWMKGFIQTTIVHLRYPCLTKREMGGWLNFLVFLLIVPGTVVVNFLNIFMMGLLFAWIFYQPAFIQDLYPLPVLYLANLVAIMGGFLFIYFTMISLYRRGKFALVRWWFFQPLYWALLSYATVRATVQLMTSPHIWEKTEHGTHLTQTSN